MQGWRVVISLQNEDHFHPRNGPTELCKTEILFSFKTQELWVLRDKYYAPPSVYRQSTKQRDFNISHSDNQTGGRGGGVGPIYKNNFINSGYWVDNDLT